MITMTRIQGHSMGFANHQKPILQSPRMGAIFGLSLAAGSPSVGVGADGGGTSPAPAPAPGAAGFQSQPSQLFPVQQIPVPVPQALTGMPTWAIVGIAILGGVILIKLL